MVKIKVNTEKENKENVIPSNTLRIVKNASGDIIGKMLFDHNEKMLQKMDKGGNITTYIYGESGKLMYTDTFEKLTKQTSRQFYRYDKWGNMIYLTGLLSVYKTPIQSEIISDYKIRYYIPDVFDEIVTYDFDHNIIQMDIPDEEVTINYEYNEKNLILNYSNTKGLSEKYTYDKNGNVMRFVRKLKEKSYIEWYKYDEQNRPIYCRNSAGKEEFVTYENFNKNKFA